MKDLIPPSRRRRYGGQAVGTWIIEDGTLDRADRRRWVLGDALRLAPAGLAPFDAPLRGSLPSTRPCGARSGFRCARRRGCLVEFWGCLGAAALSELLALRNALVFFSREIPS